MYIDNLQRTSARLGGPNKYEENRREKVWEANNVEGQRGRTILQQDLPGSSQEPYVAYSYNRAFHLPVGVTGIHHGDGPWHSIS